MGEEREKEDGSSEYVGIIANIPWECDITHCHVCPELLLQ